MKARAEEEERRRKSKKREKEEEESEGPNRARSFLFFLLSRWDDGYLFELLLFLSNLMVAFISIFWAKVHGLWDNLAEAEMNESNQTTTIWGFEWWFIRSLSGVSEATCSTPFIAILVFTQAFLTTSLLINYRCMTALPVKTKDSALDETSARLQRFSLMTRLELGCTCFVCAIHLHRQRKGRRERGREKAKRGKGGREKKKTKKKKRKTVCEWNWKEQFRSCDS